MHFTTITSLAFGLFAFFGEAATLPSNEIQRRAGRTSTPSGCLTVRASTTASGEYSTLTLALAALGAGSSTSTACIFVYSGTYNEAVYINYKGALTLYGYTTKSVIYSILP